jgi:uncharacterized protein (DUF2141 family)
MNRTVILCALGFLGISTACQPTNGAETQATVTPVTSIKVIVQGLRFDGNPAASQLCWGLFSGAQGFPSDSTKVVKKACFNVISTAMSFIIDGMPATKEGYVVSVFQDMNKNNSLDTKSFFGLQVPKEPFGFSRNPSLMGAPTFEKCKIMPTKNGEEFTIQMKSL